MGITSSHRDELSSSDDDDDADFDLSADQQNKRNYFFDSPYSNSLSFKNNNVRSFGHFNSFVGALNKNRTGIFKKTFSPKNKSIFQFPSDHKPVSTDSDDSDDDTINKNLFHNKPTGFYKQQKNATEDLNYKNYESTKMNPLFDGKFYQKNNVAETSEMEESSDIDVDVSDDESDQNKECALNGAIKNTENKNSFNEKLDELKSFEDKNQNVKEAIKLSPSCKPTLVDQKTTALTSKNAFDKVKTEAASQKEALESSVKELLKNVCNVETEHETQTKSKNEAEEMKNQKWENVINTKACDKEDSANNYKTKNPFDPSNLPFNSLFPYHSFLFPSLSDRMHLFQLQQKQNFFHRNPMLYKPVLEPKSQKLSQNLFSPFPSFISPAQHFLHLQLMKQQASNSPHNKHVLPNSLNKDPSPNKLSKPSELESYTPPKLCNIDKQLNVTIENSSTNPILENAKNQNMNKTDLRKNLCTNPLLKKDENFSNFSLPNDVYNDPKLISRNLPKKNTDMALSQNKKGSGNFFASKSMYISQSNFSKSTRHNENNNNNFSVNVHNKNNNTNNNNNNNNVNTNYKNPMISAINTKTEKMSTETNGQRKHCHYKTFKVMRGSEVKPGDND